MTMYTTSFLNTDNDETSDYSTEVATALASPVNIREAIEYMQEEGYHFELTLDEELAIGMIENEADTEKANFAAQVLLTAGLGTVSEA